MTSKTQKWGSPPTDQNDSDADTEYVEYESDSDVEVIKVIKVQPRGPKATKKVVKVVQDKRDDDVVEVSPEGDPVDDDVVEIKPPWYNYEVHSIEDDVEDGIKVIFEFYRRKNPDGNPPANH